jgi:hypothetical protein
LMGGYKEVKVTYLDVVSSLNDQSYYLWAINIKCLI